MSTRWLSALVVLGLVATPVLAQDADPAAGPEEAERSAEAERLFHEGVRLLEEGRFESAGAVLETALSLEARASTACNLATALHAQGRSWEAHQLLVRMEQREFGELPQGYAETATRLRRAINDAVARVHLAVSNPATTATVYLDGEPAELRDGDVISRVVEPGEHHVRAEAEGFVRFQRSITAEPGSVQRVDIDLTPLDALVVAPPEEQPQTANRRKRRRRIAIAIAVSLAVAAGITAGIVATRDRGPTCDGAVGCIGF